ncbi:hypothetical protein N7O58_02490 [Enterococcus dispar]|uniref:hypothetical protein n=1 Tax=Enterococcus dispar TaxID=44009 RepID=UPI0021D3F7D6|nr:hypothetical protein [Enterococcus dispar]MCU7356550.1 hypothetical protein [Enterococcus dispar]
MKEQVKEWIADKNLTTDSFDSIMIGVIYNSGHNTLDDPDVRKWIETHPNEFRLMLPPRLTDDQQVVLEWLKEEKEERCSFESAIYWYFEDDVEPDIISDRLTQREFLQILAAFAEWGMKNG